MEQRRRRPRGCRQAAMGLLSAVVVVLCAAGAGVRACGVNDTEHAGGKEGVIDRELKKYVDRMLNVDSVDLMPGVGIERTANASYASDGNSDSCESSRSLESVAEYTEKKLQQFTKTHVLAVNIPQTARFLFASPLPSAKSGSTFLTGFGMGFLAKLMLPVFIIGQLLKSVLIAMFLPSLLGGLGKIVGKGLSTVSGISGASAGVHGPANGGASEVEDFEFKDTSPYAGEDGAADEEFAAVGEPVDAGQAAGTGLNANNRYGLVGVGHQRVGAYSTQHALVQAPPLNDNYYLRRPHKKTDYKVFHRIPASSLLLTSYDPFYSPLLSRLDAVFHQLGLGDERAATAERCRERLVCMMYANPAKYAPYSNLVSAQLSRELNELKKPTSDNPEILRFFKYMKAAKDGQDGEECIAHGGCPSLSASKPSPAMLTTFNDINKLVQARNLK